MIIIIGAKQKYSNNLINIVLGEVQKTKKKQNKKEKKF
jgi:hypothetical protein